MAVKYLVVIVVVAVVLWLMFGRRRTRAVPRRDARAKELEGMVACAHCGVHLPRSEALAAGGRSYCSAAHRDAGPRSDG